MVILTGETSLNATCWYSFSTLVNFNWTLSLSNAGDQFKVSPVASPETLHHAVWRTWLTIHAPTLNSKSGEPHVGQVVLRNVDQGDAVLVVRIRLGVVGWIDRARWRTVTGLYSQTRTDVVALNWRKSITTGERSPEWETIHSNERHKWSSLVWLEKRTVFGYELVENQAL